MVIHDTKFPYSDQVSLDNPNPFQAHFKTQCAHLCPVDVKHNVILKPK